MRLLVLGVLIAAAAVLAGYYISGIAAKHTNNRFAAIEAAASGK